LFDLALQLNSAPDLYGFVFPGRESGLFGTFYELAEMAGAHLFQSDLIPDIENEAGTLGSRPAAEGFIRGIVPASLRPGITRKFMSAFAPDMPQWYATGLAITVFIEMKANRPSTGILA
jgi:hypothetical protein